MIDLLKVRLALREQECMRLICEEGLSYKEIAYKMGLTVSTAKHYGAAIQTKLGVHGAVQLTIWYWKQRVDALTAELQSLRAARTEPV